MTAYDCTPMAVLTCYMVRRPYYDRRFIHKTVQTDAQLHNLTLLETPWIKVRRFSVLPSNIFAKSSTTNPYNMHPWSDSGVIVVK